MLPTLSFTIPSIHDDTVLDCRLFSPPSYRIPDPNVGFVRKKFAVVAHPYAPLGGCYDDPIVTLVASDLMKQGFSVITFNFRGAGTSKGRTSWTAKAETSDYISIIGFVAHFMTNLTLNDNSESPRNSYSLHDLTPIPSNVISDHEIRFEKPRGNRHLSTPLLMSMSTRLESSDDVENFSRIPKIEQKPLLLLAGYSYGAMVTIRLPNLKTILDTFSSPETGSAASEISLRAQKLAKEQNTAFLALMKSLKAKADNGLSIAHRRGRSLQVDPALGLRNLSINASARVGGEETSPGLRRVSKEFNPRRSLSVSAPEGLRKSMDKFRSFSHHNSVKIFSSRGTQSQHFPGSVEDVKSVSSMDITSRDQGRLHVGDLKAELPAFEFGDMKTAYLLISPPYGILTNIITLWSSGTKASLKAIKLPEEEAKLCMNETFVIFGSEDLFISNKKSKEWAQHLSDREDSLFQYAEVAGAGHFWHEDGVVSTLRRYIKEFIDQA